MIPSASGTGFTLPSLGSINAALPDIAPVKAAANPIAGSSHLFPDQALVPALKSGFIFWAAAI